MPQVTQAVKKLAAHDAVWSNVREAAEEAAAREPILASFLHASVLNHQRLEQALSWRLAQKLGSPELPAILLRQIVSEAFELDPDIGHAARADMVAVNTRDPACESYLEPFLYFKGFHALQTYRVSRSLWLEGRPSIALFLQSRSSEVFGVDIHPAARIGRGIMIDHATGVVIGETSVVEDGVSMLQEVTLGGTGKETGDRHPKIRKGALIGAGAKVLGNIEVGECSRVGAGSIVLKDVPPHCTVAGVPARVVGAAGCDNPAREMNQDFSGEPAQPSLG